MAGERITPQDTVSSKVYLLGRLTTASVLERVVTELFAREAINKDVYNETLKSVQAEFDGSKVMVEAQRVGLPSGVASPIVDITFNLARILPTQGAVLRASRDYTDAILNKGDLQNG